MSTGHRKDFESSQDQPPFILDQPLRDPERKLIILERTAHVRSSPVRLSQPMSNLGSRKSRRRIVERAGSKHGLPSFPDRLSLSLGVGFGGETEREGFFVDEAVDVKKELIEERPRT